MKCEGVLFLSCWIGFVYSKAVSNTDLKNALLQQQPDFLDKFQYYLDALDYYQNQQYQEDPYNDWIEEDAPVNKDILEQIEQWPANDVQSEIGQVGGVAMDTNDNLVVFHRADRRWDRWSFGPLNKINAALGPIQKNVLVTVNPQTGDKISESGAGIFYMPHGLTIDQEGNRWLTDVGLHQVMKIRADDTTPSLVLGEKLVPGSDDSHFCKPTDIAVTSQGDFFVADGYCNGRIMKFSGNGTLLAKWGSPSFGMMPGNDQFQIPHSLALDEGRDLLCVADRENGRIQCFSAGINGTNTGEFRHGFEPGRGTIYAIEFDQSGDKLYVVNGPGIGIVEGFTLDPNGNILETWGPSNQDFPGQPHDVTVSRANDVYVGDIGYPSRVWKFSRGMETGAGIVGK
ncbi:hypothetical protein ACF0H5_012959 [Mactra antiquata]